MNLCFVKNCTSGEKTLFSPPRFDSFNILEWTNSLPLRERAFDPENDQVCRVHFPPHMLEERISFILKAGEPKTVSKWHMIPGAVPSIFPPQPRPQMEEKRKIESDKEKDGGRPKQNKITPQAQKETIEIRDDVFSPQERQEKTPEPAGSTVRKNSKEICSNERQEERKRVQEDLNLDFEVLDSSSRELPLPITIKLEKIPDEAPTKILFEEKEPELPEPKSKVERPQLKDQANSGTKEKHVPFLATKTFPSPSKQRAQAAIERITAKSPISNISKKNRGLPKAILESVNQDARESDDDSLPPILQKEVDTPSEKESDSFTEPEADLGVNRDSSKKRQLTSKKATKEAEKHGRPKSLNWKRKNLKVKMKTSAKTKAKFDSNSDAKNNLKTKNRKSVVVGSDGEKDSGEKTSKTFSVSLPRIPAVAAAVDAKPAPKNILNSQQKFTAKSILSKISNKIVENVRNSLSDSTTRTSTHSSTTSKATGKSEVSIKSNVKPPPSTPATKPTPKSSAVESGTPKQKRGRPRKYTKLKKFASLKINAKLKSISGSKSKPVNEDVKSGSGGSSSQSEEESESEQLKVKPKVPFKRSSSVAVAKRQKKTRRRRKKGLAARLNLVRRKKDSSSKSSVPPPAISESKTGTKNKGNVNDEKKSTKVKTPGIVDSDSDSNHIKKDKLKQYPEAQVLVELLSMEEIEKLRTKSVKSGKGTAATASIPPTDETETETGVGTKLKGKTLRETTSASKSESKKSSNRKGPAPASKNSGGKVVLVFDNKEKTKQNGSPRNSRVGKPVLESDSHSDVDMGTNFGKPVDDQASSKTPKGRGRPRKKPEVGSSETDGQSPVDLVSADSSAAQIQDEVVQKEEDNEFPDVEIDSVSDSDIPKPKPVAKVKPRGRHPKRVAEEIEESELEPVSPSKEKELLKTDSSASSRKSESFVKNSMNSTSKTSKKRKSKSPDQSETVDSHSNKDEAPQSSVSTMLSGTTDLDPSSPPRSGLLANASKPRCFVLSCTHESVKLFHSPLEDSPLFKDWLKNIPVRERPFTSDDKICSDHFPPSMLKTTTVTPRGKRTNLATWRWKLVPEAVPSIFRTPFVSLPRMITNDKNEVSFPGSQQKRKIARRLSNKFKGNAGVLEDPVLCVVPGCAGSNDKNAKNRKLTFHKFPFATNYKSLWVREISRKTGVPIPVTDEFLEEKRVCGLHFLASDYEGNVRSSPLRMTAVPSLFSLVDRSSSNNDNSPSISSHTEAAPNSSSPLSSPRRPGKKSTKKSPQRGSSSRKANKQKETRDSKEAEIETEIHTVSESDSGTEGAGYEIETEEVSLLATEEMPAETRIMEIESLPEPVPEPVSVKNSRRKQNLSALANRTRYSMSPTVDLEKVKVPSQGTNNGSRGGRRGKGRGKKRGESHSVDSPRDPTASSIFKKQKTSHIPPTDRSADNTLNDEDGNRASPEIPLPSPVAYYDDGGDDYEPLEPGNQSDTNQGIGRNKSPEPPSNANISMVNSSTSPIRAVRTMVGELDSNYSPLNDQGCPTITINQNIFEESESNQGDQVCLQNSIHNQTEVQVQSQIPYFIHQQQSNQPPQSQQVVSGSEPNRTVMIPRYVNIDGSGPVLVFEPMQFPVTLPAPLGGNSAGTGTILSTDGLLTTQNQNQQGQNFTGTFQGPSGIQVQQEQLIRQLQASGTTIQTIPFSPGGTIQFGGAAGSNNIYVPVNPVAVPAPTPRTRDKVPLRPILPTTAAAARAISPRRSSPGFSTATAPKGPPATPPYVPVQPDPMPVSSPSYSQGGSDGAIPCNQTKLFRIDPNEGKYFISRKNGKTLVKPYDVDNIPTGIIKETVVTPNQGKIVFPSPQEGETILVIVPNAKPSDQGNAGTGGTLVIPPDNSASQNLITYSPGQGSKRKSSSKAVTPAKKTLTTASTRTDQDVIAISSDEEETTPGATGKGNSSQQINGDLNLNFAGAATITPLNVSAAGVVGGSSTNTSNVRKNVGDSLVPQENQSQGNKNTLELEKLYRQWKGKLKLPNPDAWSMQLLTESSRTKHEKYICIAEKAVQDGSLVFLRVLKIKEDLNFEIFVKGSNCTAVLNEDNEKVTTVRSLQELVTQLSAFIVCNGLTGYEKVAAGSISTGKKVGDVWFSNRCEYLCLDNNVCAACSSLFKVGIPSVSTVMPKNQNQSQARPQQQIQRLNQPGPGLPPMPSLSAGPRSRSQIGTPTRLRAKTPAAPLPVYPAIQARPPLRMRPTRPVVRPNVTVSSQAIRIPSSVSPFSRNSGPGKTYVAPRMPAAAAANLRAPVQLLRPQGPTQHTIPISPHVTAVTAANMNETQKNQNENAGSHVIVNTVPSGNKTVTSKGIAVIINPTPPNWPNNNVNNSVDGATPASTSANNHSPVIPSNFTFSYLDPADL